MKRSILLLGIGVLFVLSIPWYRDPAAPVGTTAGLPDWVAVALGCYVGVAVLNALAWFWTDVPDAPPASHEDPEKQP